jgi:lipopolysaccharide transport system permease protein
MQDDIRKLWRLRSFLFLLVKRELSIRYSGTVGGAIWLYAQPILTVAAYFLVFDTIFAMRLSDKAPSTRVGEFLVVGALPWMAFCDAISRGTNSLVDNAALLQKNPLPIVLFPIKAALSSAVIYGPLILIMWLGYCAQKSCGVNSIFFIPLYLMQVTLCLVLSYLLAILAAAIRDVQQIVGFTLSLGIFLSPILFPISMFPENWHWLLWINPMTPYVLGYQLILLENKPPTGFIFAFAFISIVIVTSVLAVVTKRSKDQMIDWL